MRLLADSDAALPGLGFDTLLVMGGDELPLRAIDAGLVAAATALAANSRRVCSICTGAFILARAGLLDGHRATTHWQHAGLLARAYPGVSVEPDAIFVKDGRLFTSAGVTAGIDLALALLEDDHGEEMARTVAQSLLVFLQRPGGQSQFSPTLQAARPRTAMLRGVHDAIAADPAGDHSMPAMSARFAVSPRHLTRLFTNELGTTPAQFVATVRFDAAKTALDAGHSVSTTAGLAGYGNPESMRRAFVTRLGIPPRAYQQRFRSAQRPDATPASPSHERARQAAAAD